MESLCKTQESLDATFDAVKSTLATIKKPHAPKAIGGGRVAVLQFIDHPILKCAEGGQPIDLADTQSLGFAVYGPLDDVIHAAYFSGDGSRLGKPNLLQWMIAMHKWLEEIGLQGWLDIQAELIADDIIRVRK